ncbi:hypothetical protein JXA05_00660 [Candidatus Peregrinibacteria bacterium]|nr:hypothetical protein [Candidatus Peregrinibacteria bacterium]
MKNFTKKLLAAAVIAVFAAFLSSCGAGTTSTAASLKTYEGGDFTINVDPAWKVITKSDFYADIPQETVVAFTAPEAYDGFFINVNVVKEDLKQEAASVDYARANINLAGQNLTDYNKIQEAKTEALDTPTLIHIFEARLNPTEKLTRFVQLYATKGRYGYIVTGGMLPDTPKELRDLVGAMVTSFRLK